MTRESMGGHKIELVDGNWVYSDTKEKVDPNGPTRPCKHCSKDFGEIASTEVDPCLGKLPGVINACCGHGNPDESYVIFENGITIRGFTTVEYK